MRIAILGSGAAGLTSAWLLQDDHDVTVFEAAERTGGHIHTVTVDVRGRPLRVELGAEFFFEEGYGGLLALLDRFGIRRIRDRLCVSLKAPEYRAPVLVPPLNPRALPDYLSRDVLRDLQWLWRFGLEGEKVVAQGDWSVSVQKLTERAGAPRDVAERLLIPLIASSWGMPIARARHLSAYGVVRVMGLRAERDPHSFRLEGGLATYTDRLVEDSPRGVFKLGTPARALERTPEGLWVHSTAAPERFDAVILACDWHNSAALCATSPHLDAWTRAFRAFTDYEVTVAVHRDLRLMPANRHCWGASNFWLTRDVQPRTTVWSGRPTNTDVFRTWLRPGESEPEGTSHVAHYRHIDCSIEHAARQSTLSRLQGTDDLWAVGMYTDGIDNHESALRSALKVARRIAPNAARVRWFGQKVSR
jgi:predicted NAD/FAD-binding protein